jgi:PAS domain S-box-containing protein
VLILEDEAADAGLVVDELERSGFEVSWTRIDREEDFLRELERSPDLVLADYSVPGLDWSRALERSQAADIPFVTVSGTIGEEAAAATIRMGAADYVSKSRLARLGPAVRGAIELHGLRRAQREDRLALISSEHRYSGLFENAIDAILIADDHGRYIEANPAAAALTGYTRAELVEMRVWDLMSEPQLEPGPDPWPRFSEHVSRSGDFAIVRKDGTVVEVECRAAPGVPPGVHVCWMHDISERRRAERALADSEERFRKLAEDAQDLVYRYRLLPSRGFEYVSPSALVMTGHTAEEFYADPELGWRIVHPDDQSVAESLVSPEGGFGDPVFLRWIRADGSHLWTEQRVTPVYDDAGTLIALQGYARDVTDRIAAAVALQESEERFRQLADNVEQIFWLLQVDGEGEPQFVYVNSAFERIVGRPTEDLCRDGSVWRRSVHPDDLERALEARTRAFDGPNELEYRIVRPDGAVRWLRDRAFPVRDGEGRTIRIAGIAEDVTERKEADASHEAGLRREQELAADVRLLLESTGEGIFGLDEQRRCTFINGAGARLLGYEPEELLGMDMHAAIHHSRQDGAPYGFEECPITSALRNGEGCRIDDEVFWTQDGRPVPVEYASSPVVGDGRPAGAVVTFFDVTERRRAEDQQRQSHELLRKGDAERRELLTRLVSAQEEERQRVAADIHDDSVQVMTAVGLRLQMLRGSLAPAQAEQIGKLEETVRTSIARLRTLLFELRPRSLDTDGIPTALANYLDQTLAESGLEHRLVDRLGREPDTETRVILYRITQEAVTNVRKHAQASLVEVVLEAREGGVSVTVTDDGRGMDAEQEQRSGLPGHLGLVAMRQRAEAAGGWMRIESSPDRGTSVQFWLPLRDAVA